MYDCLHQAQPLNTDTYMTAKKQPPPPKKKYWYIYNCLYQIQLLKH